MWVQSVVCEHSPKCHDCKHDREWMLFLLLVPYRLKFCHQIIESQRKSYHFLATKYKWGIHLNIDLNICHAQVANNIQEKKSHDFVHHAQKSLTIAPKLNVSLGFVHSELDSGLCPCKIFWISRRNNNYSTVLCTQPKMLHKRKHKNLAIYNIDCTFIGDYKIWIRTLPYCICIYGHKCRHISCIYTGQLATSLKLLPSLNFNIVWRK